MSTGNTWGLRRLASAGGILFNTGISGRTRRAGRVPKVETSAPNFPCHHQDMKSFLINSARTSQIPVVSQPVMPDLGPPFHSIPGLANFRDLGNCPVNSHPGRVIKPGLIYRSAEPSRITDEGISALQALNITHVYDLRSNVEIKRHATAIREWPQSQRVFVPIFQDEDYSPEAIAIRYQNYSSEGSEGFVEAYRTILEAGSGPFATILSHLASPEASPFLVHCTAGKDRTGVICAVILSLCGVDDHTIAHEYSLTEAGLAEVKQEICEHLMKNPALKDNHQGAQRMIGAR